MRIKLLSLLILFFIFRIVQAQVHLARQWDHTFGGTDEDNLASISPTSDGGYILAGHTKSDSSGEISEPLIGIWDLWLVKTDSLGNKMWDKRFGGTFIDKIATTFQTTDGGYILGGYITSDSSGDVSEPTRGGSDYWILKTDSAGNKLWDKRFGGTNTEQLTIAFQTNDGGYMLGGWSYSDSTGDVSHHNIGSGDFWIVKTDANGTKQWDKMYGGTDTEELYYMQQTTDGGYLLGGTSASDSSFDVTEPSRSPTLKDYWIIKVDAVGNKQWNKRFGGSSIDNLLYLEQTHDHGYILGGYTLSDNDGDVSETSRDTSLADLHRGDCWIVRTDSSGNKLWDKRFGGTWKEKAFGYIKETIDHGFLMGCASYSNSSGDKTENNYGYEQSWIVKIDSVGGKLWDKTIFIDGEDEFAFALELPGGCYIIANYSEGDSSGYKSEDSRGNHDYWFIKLCETLAPQLPTANFVPDQTALCSGGCFTYINQSSLANTFQWYFPGGVPSSSTMAFPGPVCYSDTGSYTVTLIAMNVDGSDTLTIPNVVSIVPLPGIDIIPVGDTLFATPGLAPYAWFLNGNSLPFDTIYYIIATQNGNYVVQGQDSIGCTSKDTLINFVVGIREFTNNGYSIGVYPSPANDVINIINLDEMIGDEIRIHDMLGRDVYSGKINSSELKISVSSFVTGMYFISVSNDEQKINARFMKN